MLHKAICPITTYLTAPCKVAHTLDWRKCTGSVLSLSVCHDEIDLVVSPHPARCEPTQQLRPVKLVKRLVPETNRRTLDGCVAQDLAQRINNYNVCGILVNWPVQKEGRCGAPCGRVLHVLDAIAESSSGVFRRSRPICLYDHNHYVPSQDVWDRDPRFGCPPDSRESAQRYFASESQYQYVGVSAVTVWEDFCRTQWPQLSPQYESMSSSSNYMFMSSDALQAEAKFA